MQIKSSKLVLAVLALIIAFSPLAQAQKTKKKSATATKAKFKMLESFSQRVMPGRREQQPQTNYYFILVWQSKDTPTTFFWKSENAWMSCSMAYVHKTNNKNSSRFIPDANYITQNITDHVIKKGDTLQIMPVKGGKFPIPKEVDPNTNNVLYYKTMQSNWLSYPVKQINAKPDLVMP